MSYDAFNLLDETYTTVGVTFYNAVDDDFKVRGKKYHYKVPRDWNVQPGDLLVAYANQQPCVVKVVEVHEEPDFAGFAQLQYAVQRVDLTQHEALRQRERTFRDALQAVERQRQKDELLETLQKQAGNSSHARTLLGEALALIGAPMVGEPPRADAARSVPDPVTGQQGA